MKDTTGLPPTAQPWGRIVDARTARIERVLGLQSDDLSALPVTDKTVSAEFVLGQNFGPNQVGVIAPVVTPVRVRYASSTGFFSVTVTMSGLVRDGATLAAGATADDYPPVVQNGIPLMSFIGKSLGGETGWTPIGGSHTTVLSTLPGVYDFSVFLYANVPDIPNAAAYLQRVQLSIVAV